MKGKHQQDKDADSDDEQTTKDSEPKDTKLNFDLKTFWKNISEKYFKHHNDLNVNEINHLLHFYSKYDLNNDHIYTKISFPKTLNCLMGKTIELESRKNNPVLYAKSFGMYIYLDKYDYLINNINNNEIDDEIQAIEEKLNSMETNNLLYCHELNGRVTRYRKKILIDLYEKQSLKYRLDNIVNQIYILQMRQFAESISIIKKDMKRNKYYVWFDCSEGVDSLELDERVYRNLLNYRDAMNSVSVYDLFQEKIHLYHNVGKNEKKVSHSKKTRVGKDEIQIPKVISINYDFCHHCKQRKPGEIMIRCMSSNCNKYIEKPSKSFQVNNTTILKHLKNFIITNYTGDGKDIIEGYSYKKYSNPCNRSFCHYCLKGSYDQIIEQIKDKKDWICPYCQGVCFCSRCSRMDQILKLITLYVSLNGEIKDVNNILSNKSIVLNKLGESMVVNSVIVIHNIPNKTQNNLIKNKIDVNNIEAIIETATKYKNDLINIKGYFDSEFTKAFQEKELLREEKSVVELGYETSQQPQLLNKKRKDKPNKFIRLQNSLK